MDELPGFRQSQSDEPLTRAYLESLTNTDLIRIADSYGVDIPYDLDRIFIIEELLEITSSDADPPEPDIAAMDVVVAESVPLPKQYNITFIKVMIRDPLWAFVFWEIKQADKEQFEKAPDFDGYYLKIIPRNKSAQGSGGMFTVPVKPDDTAWYLGLNSIAADEIFLAGSPAGTSAGISLPDQFQFTVELCVSLRGEETVIVSSKPIRLPGLSEPPGRACKQDHPENQLAYLSGLGNFHILRKNERMPRTKKLPGKDSASGNAEGSYE